MLVQPDQVRHGQSATVAIETDADIEHLFLMPGGSVALSDYEFTGEGGFLQFSEKLLLNYQPGTGIQLLTFDAAKRSWRQQGMIAAVKRLDHMFLVGRRLYVTTGAELKIFLLNDRLQIEDRRELTLPGEVLGLYSDNDESLILLLKGQDLIKVGMQPRPLMLRMQSLDFSVRSFVVEGDTGYFLGEDNRFYVLNLDSKRFGSVQSSYQVTGDANALQVHEGIAYIAGSQGLTLLSVAKAEQPRWLASNHKVGAISLVAVRDGRAAVVDRRGRLSIVDVSHKDRAFSLSYHWLDWLPDQLVWADDGALWVSADLSLQLIDVSVTTPTQISTEGRNFGGSRRAFVEDNRVYVADWFSGLHIYDVKDPARPGHMGGYHTPGSAKGVLVRNGVAFVGDDDHGLQVLDVHDSAHPRRLASLALPGLVYTMQLFDDTLYVASHRGGFYIVDVADVRQPRLLGGVDTPGKAWALAKRKNTLYVADDSSGVLVFDVTKPEQPVQKGSFDPGGFAEDIVIRDRYAYVCFFDKGLYVLDLASPYRPKPIAHLPIPGNARGIALQDDLAVIAAWDAGVFTVDIKKPREPRILGQYDTDGSTWGVNVRGSQVYALDWWGGFKILDISDVSRPRLLGRYQGGDKIQDVTLQGDYAFAAQGARGLQIYDVKNPVGPIWLSGLDLPAPARTILVVGRSAYIGTDTGVVVVNIHDPFEPQLLGQWTTRSPVRHLLSLERERLLVQFDNGLQILGVAIPARIEELQAWQGDINDIQATAPDSWLLTNDSGLLELKQVDGRLVEGRSLAMAGLGRLQLGDRMAWVSQLGNGIHGINLANSWLEPISFVSLGMDIADFLRSGETIYALTSQNLLVELDISQPKQPQPVSIVGSVSPITRIAQSQQALFFAGDEILASVELPPRSKVIGGQGRFTVEIPATMPAGGYHVVGVTARGKTLRTANRFRIQSPVFSKPKFSLEDLKRAMQQRGLDSEPLQ